jgi:spore coat protein U-like protein
MDRWMNVDLHGALRLLALVLAIAAPSSALAAPKCNGGGNPAQVTATNLSFGNYNAASPTATTANATITVSCVDPARDLPAFTVALSVASNPRQLTSGANTLNYNIFTTSAYTTVWGDGTNGTVTQSHVGGALNSFSYTAYGRIPAGQFVPTGSYTQTITVTVTY